MPVMRIEPSRLAMLALAAFTAAAEPARADSVADFYKGRTINYFLATTAGGSWDVYLRVLINHWVKHIPGNPAIVLQYQPGGGGVKTLEYMYGIAPKDGTAIATPLPTSLVYSALNPRAVSYKPQRFQWIGNMARTQDVISVWHAVPIKTIADAQEAVATMGVTGPGSNTFFDIAMANSLLGTKFKMVQGYRGSVELDLAMERRETDGRANTWDGWAAAKPDWLAKKWVVHLVQIGLSKLPEIGDVPLFLDLLKNPADRQVAEFLSAAIALGRTIFAPPDVPAERIAALRRAFDATMTDPAYLEECKTRNLSTGGPMTGEQMEALMLRMFGSPPELTERAKATVTPK
jgi:tripartite-type tricarboxylate transporter receptor subunit TctC